MFQSPLISSLVMIIHPIFVFAVVVTANVFFKPLHLTAKHEQYNNDDEKNADGTAADPDAV